MDAPQEVLYSEPRTGALMILFRIIGRRDWDNLQGWHEALHAALREHLMFGIYVLHDLSGGARRLAG